MKHVIRTLMLGVFVITGGAGLTMAISTAAHAQDEPGGTFVSSITSGFITKISGNHITMKTGEGDVYDIIVLPNAKLEYGSTTGTGTGDTAPKPIKLSDMHIGSGVNGAGWLKDKTLRAVSVFVFDGKELQAFLDTDKKYNTDTLGITHVIGTVTAIDNNRLTIKRTDNVVQVIEVGKSTSFQSSGRGGQANATLADVKVGSMVTAAGAPKNEVFIAKQVYLIQTQ